MSTFFKSFFVFFLAFPFFAVSMEPDYPEYYPQLQLGRRRDEKELTGTLEMISLPEYLSGAVFKNRESELYKFNLDRNNPAILCKLIPDASNHKNMNLMVPIQSFVNCNNESKLDVRGTFADENNTQEHIVFHARCKASKEFSGSTFKEQLTNAMDLFYEHGAQFVKEFPVDDIEDLINSRVIKRGRRLPTLSVHNVRNGTMRVVPFPYELEHGNNGCGSVDDLIYIITKNEMHKYGSRNMCEYVLKRQTGKLAKSFNKNL